MTLRCPNCGHEVVEDTRAKEARREAERHLKSIGATLEGPFCIDCHKAGRGDVQLLPMGEAPAA